MEHIPTCKYASNKLHLQDTYTTCLTNGHRTGSPRVRSSSRRSLSHSCISSLSTNSSPRTLTTRYRSQAQTPPHSRSKRKATPLTSLTSTTTEPITTPYTCLETSYANTTRPSTTPPKPRDSNCGQATSTITTHCGTNQETSTFSLRRIWTLRNLFSTSWPTTT